LQVAAEVK